jgi:hypothetical protein
LKSTEPLSGRASRRHVVTPHWRRRLLSLPALLALLAIGAAITYAYFTGLPGTATGQATVGTLTIGTPVEHTCTVVNVAPGDATAGWVSQNSTGAVDPANGTEGVCTFQVAYTGNVPAYFGLDLAITGAGNGGNGLYDGTASGLQFLVHDTDAPNTIFANGHPFAAAGGSASATHLLVNSTPLTTGAPVTIAVDYYLPSGAGNAYEAASSALSLTLRAAPSANNPPGGTTSTPGQPATDITWG